MDNYRALFDVMSRLCGHINAEMKKTSYYALEAFLKQVNAPRLFHTGEENKSGRVSGTMMRIKPPVIHSLSFQHMFFCYFKVAMLVADNIEEHKSKLKFFMQKFCGIIRTMDSTHKELSIAIRGYGFFAAVRFICFQYSCRNQNPFQTCMFAA